MRSLLAVFGCFVLFTASNASAEQWKDLGEAGYSYAIPDGSPMKCEKGFCGPFEISLFLKIRPASTPSNEMTIAFDCAGNILENDSNGLHWVRSRDLPSVTARMVFFLAEMDACPDIVGRELYKDELIRRSGLK